MNSEPSPKYSAFVRLPVLFHFEPIVPTFDVDYRSLEHVHESVFVWISHFSPTFVHNFQNYSDGSNIFAIEKQERLVLFCFSLTLAGWYWMFLGGFECFYLFFTVLCIFVFLTLFSFYKFGFFLPPSVALYRSLSLSVAFSLFLLLSVAFFCFLSLSVALYRFLSLSIVFYRFTTLSHALLRSLSLSAVLYRSLSLSTALYRPLSLFTLFVHSLSRSLSPSHLRLHIVAHFFPPHTKMAACARFEFNDNIIRIAYQL